MTGLSETDDGTRRGPVINSRRQLGSVANYLSMVQDVVFGLKTSWDGIGFPPFITARLRNETFHSMKTIEWRNFIYQGTCNNISVHLPPLDSFSQGVCTVDCVELNGKPVTGEFVPAALLQPTNKWDIFLKPPDGTPADIPIRNVDIELPNEVFAPAQPQWAGGVTMEDGRVVLSCRHEDVAHVFFNIYRDGTLCAGNIRATRWIDPLSGDEATHVHTYTTAVDRQSGLCSHLTPCRSNRTSDQQQVIPRSEIINSGGDRIGNQHVENWGKQHDELETRSFIARQGGRHAVRVEFANGSGPITTGITCAVKKMEIRSADSGEVVSSGYLVMPQSGNWQRWTCPTLSSRNWRRAHDTRSSSSRMATRAT